MRILRHLLLAFSITALSAGAADLPDYLVRKLSATLQELCPDGVAAGWTVSRSRGNSADTPKAVFPDIP